MENFFGIWKQEMYDGMRCTSVKEWSEEIEQYIAWYNNDRIKAKRNGLSPIEYNLQAA